MEIDVHLHNDFYDTWNAMINAQCKLSMVSAGLDYLDRSRLLGKSDKHGSFAEYSDFDPNQRMIEGMGESIETTCCEL